MAGRFAFFVSLLPIAALAGAVALAGVYALRSVVRSAQRASLEAYFRESGLPAPSEYPTDGEAIWIVAGALAAAGAVVGAYGVARVALMQRARTQRALASAMDETSLRGADVALPARDAQALGETAQAFARMRGRLRAGADSLERERDRLKNVLAAMSEGVLAVDGERKALLANPSFRRMFALETTVFEGRDFKEVVRHRAVHETIEKALRDGESGSAEIEIGGGARRSLAVAVGALAQGDPASNARRGAVAVFRDITELRRLERLRHEFVQNVSHELKTPLASIRAYAETLKIWGHDDPAKVELCCSRIEEAVDRLNGLILDMLQIARIEAGQQAFEIVRVNVGERLDACRERFQERAAVKGIELAREPLADNAIWALADEQGLRTALDNLVDNAVKYTSEGGAVRLGARREGAMIAIEVRDTGIGIDPDHQSRIFERFYRTDTARSRDLGGTGLGLSIVKHLIQGLGGDVRVSSVPNEGSTFTMRLPAAPKTPSP